MINPMDLTGKRYIVTGASSGLGRQVCITLSQLGAEVILIARNIEKLEKTLALMETGNHSYYAFDLSNLEKIENLLKDIIHDKGRLDGLVHCAGLGTMKPLNMTTPKFMTEMMNVNVLSFIELVRVISKKKNCNQGASIVAVSSAASIRGDKAKTAYCTTKGALDSAVLALAAELGVIKKIRVNTVNPAWIKTDMYQDYIEATGEEKERELEERQFLGLSEPVEIANVIAFLLSNASAQITGQSIIVDGGRTIW